MWWGWAGQGWMDGGAVGGILFHPFPSRPVPPRIALARAGLFVSVGFPISSTVLRRFLLFFLLRISFCFSSSSFSSLLSSSSLSSSSFPSLLLFLLAPRPVYKPLYVSCFVLLVNIVLRLSLTLLLLPSFRARLRLLLRPIFIRGFARTAYWRASCQCCDACLAVLW